MSFVRAISVFLFAAIVLYTGLVVVNYGPNFLTPFFAGLFALTWQGQFNLDFASYLALSALWVGWRHQFSPIGIVLALIASISGMLFFAPYVFIAAGQAKGNIEAFVLGHNRAKANT